MIPPAEERQKCEHAVARELRCWMRAGHHGPCDYRRDVGEPTALLRLREALETLVGAATWPTTCPHDSEPDICDGCRYAMEQAIGKALNEARVLLTSLPAREDE